MSIGRTAGTTHPGRKRRRNEDSFVCDPPLFAVADGMGGAQAGALASRLAAGALRDESDDGAKTAEERVVALIQEANRRVYERASEDEGATGMGTTMTVALVENERVVLGHVGDSRAYLLREGRLEQLTEDHSLVAELVRGGKLSPEEADSHPQRSVITRALGPDPDVDVDVFSVAAHPGDLFLLCSDGLTSMVDDERIVALVDEHQDDLEAAARALVQAANDAGGEDNITVVCFEIVGEGEEPATRSTPTLVTGDPGIDDGEDDTLDELDGVPAASITMIRPAPRLETPEAVAEHEAVPRRRPIAQPRRRSRAPLFALLALLVLVLLVGAGLWGVSRAHFVGAQENGHVAVYQGLPYDIVGDVRLYRAVYVSPVLAGQLTQDERGRIFNHELESKGSAMATVRKLEQELGHQP